MPLSPKTRPWLITGACLAWVLFCLFIYLRSLPESPVILPLVPLAFLFVLFAVRHFEGFLLTMVGVVPISVGITDMGGGFGASLPGEAILLLAAIGIGFMVIRGKINPIPLLTHPIGIVIILQLAWALITLLNSQYQTISTKFLIARIVYIGVYYIGFGTLFQRIDRIPAFFKAYLWGLIPVMIWSIFHLLQYGLSRKFSPVMAEPFYDDHTVFGAALAMVLPLAGWVAFKDHLRWSPVSRINLAWATTALVVVALLLSFSRAAWIGLFVIGIAFVFLRLRIRFRYFALALVILAGAAWIGRDSIVKRFQENENVSGEDILTTAASVTNVNTDDSNKERLNRWSCAIRMFEERPWMGFGPGTYERCYGDFQIVEEMTRISTWEGDRGDAHSEHLGALAEQGLPGMFLLGGLFLMSLRVGIRILRQTDDPLRKGLTMAILLSLSTYYFHGFVNDFLDIDKVAVLFWGMMAMLAAIDLQTLSGRGLQPNAAPAQAAGPEQKPEH